MSERLVTIIVPVFNAEKYLVKCLNSIKSQTYKNLEIIIVDDGSKDRSSQICDEFARDDKRFVVIHKENEGVCIARNSALKIAKGEYVLFVDSDDWLENNMVELMLEDAIKNNSDIVICEYNNYYENENRIEPKTIKENPNLSFQSQITKNETNFGGFPWNKLLRKNGIEKYFNEQIHYYENLLFFLENSNAKTKYSVVHKKLYNYCINDGSAIHSKKYSVKKVTTLEALIKVIPLVPLENKDYHKYMFISSYYDNYYSLRIFKMDRTIVNPYYKYVREYYKEVRFSKYLDIKKKIKVFVLYRFSSFYSLFKFIKYRVNN